DNALRHQVSIAVVVERDRLGRLRRSALEGDLPHRRVLAPTMTGAETRLLPRRRGTRGIAAPPARLRCRWRDRLRLALLAKYGDADHTDVLRAAGARGIRVGKRGEVEGRGLREALAPPQDVIGAPGAQHI